MSAQESIAAALAQHLNRGSIPSQEEGGGEVSAEQGTTDVIAVLEGLGVAVRTVRLMRGLSLRAAADEAGVSFSTLTRIEHGEDYRVTSAIPLLRWIAAPPDYQPEDFTDEAVELAQSYEPEGER